MEKRIPKPHAESDESMDAGERWLCLSHIRTKLPWMIRSRTTRTHLFYPDRLVLWSPVGTLYLLFPARLCL